MVKDYDRWSLFPMLLKCHHVVHLLLEYEIMENQLNDEDYCLDIFDMTIGTSELAKESVNRELQIF
jgi:hypothetical protein